MSGDGGFSAPWGTPGPNGVTPGGGPGGGLTDADRDAAVGALDVHRAAGRIDDVGFEERSVRARRAVTRADLDLLFLDLPEPHPVAGPPSPPALPPAAPSYGTPQAPAPVGHPGMQRPPSAPPVPYSQPGRGLVRPELARNLVRLAPILALVLFFVTRQWYFFLLIPVVGVFFGDGGRGRRGRRRP